MARYRLINCEFLAASSFKNMPNKAKLLYLSMLFNADDVGFVDSTDDIIASLEKNDNEYEKSVSLELLENTYKSGLLELINNGYVYEFEDNHAHKVHLIRHWFYHNKWKKGLWTNYKAFQDKVYLENNEYKLGKKPLKENKSKETNINENKLNDYELSDNEKEQIEDKGDDYLPFEV